MVVVLGGDYENGNENQYKAHMYPQVYMGDKGKESHLVWVSLAESHISMYNTNHCNNVFSLLM